jgi:hypothetical protein
MALAEDVDRDADHAGLDAADWRAILDATETVRYRGGVVVHEYRVAGIRDAVRAKIQERAGADTPRRPGRWPGVGPSLIKAHNLS